jgi:hypothetical protein
MLNPHPGRAPVPLPEQAGFLLPLSIASTLLMLISGVSLQLAMLQGQRVQAAQMERSGNDDALVSAAHGVAAQLQGPYSCLRAQPFSNWQGNLPPAGCLAGLQPKTLVETELWGRRVEVSNWQPSIDADGTVRSGVLSVRLPDSGMQRRFTLGFAPEQAVREAG